MQKLVNFFIVREILVQYQNLIFKHYCSIVLKILVILENRLPIETSIPITLTS